MKIISIVVPVYNVEKYIRKCLESLLNQSIIDFIQIIVVNDGSKDNSEDIIIEYLNKYPQHIKYYKQENKGLSAARNLGIDKCNTEYIGFVDSDDYVSVDMYEKLYKNIIKENSDISICNLKKCDINGKILSYKKFKIKNILNKEEAIECILNGSISAYAWNKLYKTNLFKYKEIIYPVGRLYEDTPTTYKLIENSTRISIIDEPLYYYVQHEKSICNKPTLKSAYDLILNLDYMDVNKLKNTKLVNSFIINTIVSSKILYYRAIYGDKNTNYSKDDINSYNHKISEYKGQIKPMYFIRDKNISTYNKLKFFMEHIGLLKYIYIFIIRMGR